MELKFIAAVLIGVSLFLGTGINAEAPENVESYKIQCEAESGYPAWLENVTLVENS